MATTDTPGWVSNSSLASRISALLDGWNKYKNALRDLLTKPSGTVDMEDGNGEIVTLPSMPELQSQVDAMLSSGSGAVASAQASASSAASSASESNGYAQESLTHAQEAQGYSDEALTHATAAATSAQAASGSEAAAAASAASATASKDAAAASASSADASAAAAGSSASGAAASESSSAASATDAANSASEARSWALTAQTTVTGLLHYMGSWDASGGSFPPSPATGDFWKIGTAGTLGGKDMAVGDQIIYSGTGWDKIDNTESVTAVAGMVGDVSLGVSNIVGLESALGAKAAVDSPTFTGPVTVSNNSLRMRGWGDVLTNGVVYFGTGDSWVYKQGSDFLLKNEEGGWIATLSSGGTVWTSDTLDKTKLQTDGTQGENRLTRDVLQSTTLKSGIFANDGQGLYKANGSTLAVGGWWHVINMYHAADGYGAQIAVELSSTSANTMLFRSSGGTNWREWNTVWHDGNFNPATKANLNTPTFGGNVMFDTAGGDYSIRFVNGGTLQGLIGCPAAAGRICTDSDVNELILRSIGQNVRISPGGATAYFAFNGNTNFYRRRGNMSYVAQPMMFVQSADPGSNANDGDLWIW